MYGIGSNKFDDKQERSKLEKQGYTYESNWMYWEKK